MKKICCILVCFMSFLTTKSMCEHNEYDIVPLLSDRVFFEYFDPEDRQILIVGSAEFIDKTREALALIRKTDVDMWNMVVKYIGVIALTKKTGVYAWQKPSVSGIGPTVFQNVVYSASGFCHEACHSKLFHEYKEKYGEVPDLVWSGREAENKCLDVQIEFYKKLNISAVEKRSNIQYLEKMKTVDYFSNYNY